MKKRSKTTKEAVYINPLTDFGFKKIFGDKELLIAFLND
ncbi:MAG: Rpn family recombination-promoting nuclease/putative transposase, partial [Prevotellaceae bacterium]|nr:Rpn family recombination-promoting nuclease/putative transposase [Prevotellaceae bacterium]